MEKSIKILHAADLHMDSPFDGLDAEKAALRRQEGRELLHRLAKLARVGKADIVLLSGDLLDGGRAYGETVEALCSALGEMDAPVFIAPGNHDPYIPGSVYEKGGLPGNVHIFKTGTMECVVLPELSARVWGAAFTDSRCGALLRGFSAKKQRGVTDIMVLHGDVGNPASPYDPISEAELAASGMDYAALGHMHSFSGLRRAGNTFYAWPGCAEGRGFDECGEKGAIMAEVSPGRADIRFIALGARRYERLEIDLTDMDDVSGAIEAALPENTERDIYSLILTGECAAPPDVRMLESALSGRFFALQLRDKTRPRRELWEKCGEDTLRGLFLTKLRREYDAAQTEAERDRIALAARCGIMALDGKEDPSF